VRELKALPLTMPNSYISVSPEGDVQPEAVATKEAVGKVPVMVSRDRQLLAEHDGGKLSGTVILAVPVIPCRKTTQGIKWCYQVRGSPEGGCPADNARVKLAPLSTRGANG